MLQAEPEPAVARTPSTELVLPLVVFAAAFSALTLTLGKVMNPALDEGVYLYAARLMAGGSLPYRDFFLSHPPWTMVAAAIGLRATGFDPVPFDALYTAWCLSPVFPIYATVRSLGSGKAPALLASLFFVTFPELVRWDARFFALRQASLPFLALAFWALYARRRPALCGVFLGLFGAGLFPHAILAVLFAAAVALVDARENGGFVAGLRRNRGLLLATTITLALAWVPLLLAPAGSRDLFAFQLGRQRVPVAIRLQTFRDRLAGPNAVLLGAGLLGSVLARRSARAIGAFNLVGIPVILFGPASFYPHYISSFGVGLAVTGGSLLATLSVERRTRLALTGATGALAVVVAAADLNGPLRRETPDLFRVVDALRRVPDPLLSFEPIYALHAGRRLTPHPYVADMRYFRVSGLQVLDDTAFFALCKGSSSVLVEPYLASTLTPARREVLLRDFRKVYADTQHVVLVRKTN